MSQGVTVIKIGTGVLTRTSDATLDRASLVRLVTAVAELVASGTKCVMVSSGAVGAGVAALGRNSYPEDVASRQACAAIGQCSLMHIYQTLFQNFGLQVGQLLLTKQDLNDKRRCQRVQDTLEHLLTESSVVPIINENDSVCVKELSVGDNDMLSARVSRLLGAERLILLSTIDGLDGPNGSGLVKEVHDVKDVESFARKDSGKFSIGGMASKLKAIKYATESGIETIISNGRKPNLLADIVAGEPIGTRFYAR